MVVADCDNDIVKRISQSYEGCGAAEDAARKASEREAARRRQSYSTGPTHWSTTPQ